MSLPEDRQAKAPASSREDEKERSPIGKRTDSEQKKVYVHRCAPL